MLTFGDSYGVNVDDVIKFNRILSSNEMRELAEKYGVEYENKYLPNITEEDIDDPMVDEQYRKDLFGDNDVKLEIETDDDMLEALARFYSNYRTGNETRDEVAARMASWLTELQELRAMKRNLKSFMDDFTWYKNSTRAWTKNKSIFGNGNDESTSYAQGKLSALNTIDSYIDKCRLNYYNREEQ